MYHHLVSFTVIAISFARIWRSASESTITPQTIDARPSPNENTHRRAQHTPPGGSSAAKTSLLFTLPDELILHILSFISPDPQHSDHFARFRAQYNMIINDRHRKRVEFLRPLSMTCRVMRSRFTPWIWERLELFPRRDYVLWSETVWKQRMVFDTFTENADLATIVNFLTVHFTLDETLIPLFVRCLEALPNLHALEIVRSDSRATGEFRTALRGIELPQIKTLILPATAHPLLKHCREVEDVCVVTSWDTPSDGFLRSLMFNQNSKIRRLAIPLTKWDDSSWLVIGCPQLTELTVIYPLPGYVEKTEHGLQSSAVKPACTAILEIADACKMLPDFDTLQIVHLFDGLFPLQPALMRYRGHRAEGGTWFDQERTFKAGVGKVKDTAIEALRWKQRQEGDGTKGRKVTVRVIELDWVLEFDPDWCAQRTLGSVKVEEYEAE